MPISSNATSERILKTTTRLLGTIVAAAAVETTDIEHPVPLGSLEIVSTAVMPLFTRNAAGDWYWERTATGAETIYVSVPSDFLRTTASKGRKIKGMKVAYELGVVAATSVDATYTSTVFAQGVNPAVTAAHGGAVLDAQYDAAHDTAAERADQTVVSGEHLLSHTLATPVYFVTASAHVRPEITFVLANTGTLKVRYVALVTTELLQ